VNVIRQPRMICELEIDRSILRKGRDYLFLFFTDNVCNQEF